METNMSVLDRLIRGILVAPVAIALALIVGWTSVAGVVLLVLAAIMLVTAVVGFCPLYALLRVRTNAKANT